MKLCLPAKAYSATNFNAIDRHAVAQKSKGKEVKELMSINLDLTPFFDSLNTYLPTFLGIFGLIGGIAAAIAFGRFIIRFVVDALSGKGMSG